MSGVNTSVKQATRVEITEFHELVQERETAMSGKDFSEAQMRRYFKGSGNRTGAISLIIVGILLIGVGLASNMQPLALVGLAPIVLGFIIVVRSSQPTDQEYDQWVDKQRALIASTALQKVHMDPSELIRELLSLHGVILLGSAKANPYRDNIYSKKVKDGFYTLDRLKAPVF